jgi:DNA-binding NarL/FixJ family response regulator
MIRIFKLETNLGYTASSSEMAGRPQDTKMQDSVMQLLMIDAMPIREIAAQLNRSRKTIYKHVRNYCERTGQMPPMQRFRVPIYNLGDRHRYAA